VEAELQPANCLTILIRWILEGSPRCYDARRPALEEVILSHRGLKPEHRAPDHRDFQNEIGEVPIPAGIIVEDRTQAPFKECRSQLLNR
jgi:hypothetical protein